MHMLLHHELGRMVAADRLAEATEARRRRCYRAVRRAARRPTRTLASPRS